MAADARPSTRTRRSTRYVPPRDRESELPQVQNRPVAPKTQERRRTALGVLLVLSFVAVARIAAPVWLGIVFGALMAFTTQPLYRQLCVRIGGRRRLSALITTVATGTVATVGGGLAVYVLTRELFGVINLAQHKLATGSLAGLIGSRGVKLIHGLGLSEGELFERVELELGRATTYVTQAAGLIVTTTATAMLALMIGCITMYYVLIEWPSIPVRLERVLPLDPRHTRALVLEFRDVGRSAMVGTMATAVVQGVIATIGYTISDLPHAVTWGLLTAIASFFPVAGTALVWVPVSLHYLGLGHLQMAVVQLLWGLVLVVGFGDYVVRPRLVGGTGGAQPLLTLVAALGGVEVFGLAGLVVGPVLMSLFVAILRIYEREMEADIADTRPITPLDVRLESRAHPSEPGEVGGE